MIIQLRYEKEKNTDMFSINDENIEFFIEEEFDGPEFLNIMLKVTESITALTTTFAVTLTAINKSIDEFKKITKRVFDDPKKNSEVGIYEQGIKILGKNATNKEIDLFFENLKEKAKSEIENHGIRS